MRRLWQTIRGLVADERYLIGQHATERLEERGVLEWQIVDGLAVGELLSERPNDEPNPSIEVRQYLADGTPVMVVWAWLTRLDMAKLVTVHFFDEIP